MDRRSRTVPGVSKKINVNEVVDTIIGKKEEAVETETFDPDVIKAVPKKKSTKKKK